MSAPVPFVRTTDADAAGVSDHLPAAKFLGERLRELRRRHALTQEQAAALCGMEYKYYQMVEWGRKNLRLDTMARIAGAYHLEIWDLVQQKGLPPSRIERTGTMHFTKQRSVMPKNGCFWPFYFFAFVGAADLRRLSPSCAGFMAAKSEDFNSATDIPPILRGLLMRDLGTAGLKHHLHEWAMLA